MLSTETANTLLKKELEAARKRIAELESQVVVQQAANNLKQSDGLFESHPSTDYLRSLLRSIPDLIWLKDPAGIYLNCNTSFERFFGAKESEIVGKTDYDFVSEELADFFRLHDQKAMQADKPSINEEWLTFADNGHRGLFETIKTPMRDGNGRLIGVLGIARDITDRKQTEAQLIYMKDRAEAANRVKSEFLANMSHEIRTPLNGALSMLQLLATTSLSPKQAEYLHAVTISIQRLNRLLSDILDISKIEAGKFRIEAAAFDVKNLEISILDLFSQAASTRGNSLEFLWHGRIPEAVVGDEARLRQILFNLVGNAIKFTENGQVCIDVSFVPSSHDSSVYMHFSVADTGTGLTDEQIKEVFEPFVQAEEKYARRYQGAGLGLSIVRKLVHLMHGELAIDNGSGIGTTIYVSLPMTVDRQSRFDREKCATENVDDTIQSMKILLAEDDDISSIAGKVLLEKAGHIVTCVKNGLEVIQMLSADRFDLIFMDIQMPFMDGIEATKKIRSSIELGRKSEIPIIALTAYSMIGDREVFLAAGMNDYIAKPMSMEQINKAILQVQKSRQQ